MSSQIRLVFLLACLCSALVLGAVPRPAAYVQAIQASNTQGNHSEYASCLCVFGEQSSCLFLEGTHFEGSPPPRPLGFPPFPLAYVSSKRSFLSLVNNGTYYLLNASAYGGQINIQSSCAFPSDFSPFLPRLAFDDSVSTPFLVSPDSKCGLMAYSVNSSTCAYKALANICKAAIPPQFALHQQQVVSLGVSLYYIATVGKEYYLATASLLFNIFNYSKIPIPDNLSPGNELWFDAAQRRFWFPLFKKAGQTGFLTGVGSCGFGGNNFQFYDQSLLLGYDSVDYIPYVPGTQKNPYFFDSTNGKQQVPSPPPFSGLNLLKVFTKIWDPQRRQITDSYPATWVPCRSLDVMSSPQSLVIPGL